MIDYPFRTEPRPHQSREFALYRDERARALLWFMRTGKSKAMVDLACYLWTEGKIDAVVIVAPNGVHENWTRNEMRKHAWAGVLYRALHWDSSVVKRKWFEATRTDLLRTGSGLVLPVLALNSEGLLADTLYNTLKRFYRNRRVLLIVDESDDFSRPGSKRTKRMRAVAAHAAYVRILTGTAVSDTPLAAYSQFQLLEKGALGFETFEEFESHFAVYDEKRGFGGRTYKTLSHFENMDELRDAIARWSSVVLREHVQGLSQLLQGDLPFHMTPRQEETYAAMLEGILHDPDKEEDVDPEWEEEPFAGGAKLVKLQQIASGFVKRRDGTILNVLGRKSNPRIEALIEQVERYKGKSIIWCTFKEDIRQVREALSARKGRRVVEYHGAVTSRVKEAGLAAFQDPDSGVTDLIGQPQSLGRGRDASAAEQVIWYSHIFSNKLREQASERASTVGKDFVPITNVQASGTVDEYMLEMSAKKQTVADDVAGRGLVPVVRDLEQRFSDMREGTHSSPRSSDVG